MTPQEWLEKLMLNLKKKRLVGREGFVCVFFLAYLGEHVIFVG